MKRAASTLLHRVSSRTLSPVRPKSAIHPRSICTSPPDAASAAGSTQPATATTTTTGSSTGGLQTLCKLTLIGRTGTAPHMHTFPNGRASLRLRVATNHLQRGPDGENELATQWLTVFVSDVTSAFNVVRDVPVGSLLYVEGSLRLVDRSSASGASAFANVHVDRGGVLRVLQWNRPRVDDRDDAHIFPADE